MSKSNKYRFTSDYLKNEINLILKLDILTEIVSFFKCHRCSRCCMTNSPNLLSDEYEIHKHNTYWKTDNRVSLKKPCPFFDISDNNDIGVVDDINSDINNANGFCNINDNKPRLCKIFPLITSQSVDRIVIHDCQLGRDILQEYFKFLNETNRKSNIDFDVECILKSSFIFDNDIDNVIHFLFWLKRKYKKCN